MVCEAGGAFPATGATAAGDADPVKPHANTSALGAAEIRPASAAATRAESVDSPHPVTPLADASHPVTPPANASVLGTPNAATTSAREKEYSLLATSKKTKHLSSKTNRLKHIMSRSESKSMLAIDASLSGRSLPVWNVDVPSDVVLRHVLVKWAQAILQLQDVNVPEAAWAAGKHGGPALNLDSRIVNLRPQLPVKGGRLSLVVWWPAERCPQPADKKLAPARTGVKASLSKLRISARYANVDQSVMGYHRSSNMQKKFESGFYGKAGSWGVKLPTGYGEAMRPSPGSGLCGGIATVWRGPLQSRELVVYAREQGGDELFRARLVGPEAQIANWAATIKKFEAQGHLTDGPGKEFRSIPFPVFVPSRGRADCAHLNWEAPHAFGRPRHDARPGSWPVLCVVVEPQEEGRYREVWPGALLLVLPKGGQGPSYARWVVQRICTRAYEWKANIRRKGIVGVCGPLRQLPWCWVCDDNLICFFRLVGVAKDSSKEVVVQKTREWDQDTPMFWEAMVAVQQHPNLVRSALAGFLRDDGTASCKKRDWKLDELSLYKVILLNNRELKRLGVEYLPGLQKFEDIHLNNAVQRGGGHSLKCQCYCFRAAQMSKGGCENQRHRSQKRKASTSDLGALMDPKVFRALSAEQQAAVNELLQWVQLRENQCKTKKMRLMSLGTPKPAQMDRATEPTAKVVAKDVPHTKQEGKQRQKLTKPELNVSSQDSGDSSNDESSDTTSSCSISFSFSLPSDSESIS